MQIAILEAAWGRRKGYAVISTKDPHTGAWGDHFFRWPKERNKLTSFVDDNEDQNLYFAPALFAVAIRREEHVLPVATLWADLDEAPPSKCTVQPSVAWESSPHRYQALWRLDHELSITDAKELNKRMTYANVSRGADKSGWDMTQVLRLPGTTNYKYVEQPTVRLMWAKKDRVYNPQSLVNMLPSLPSSTDLTDITELDVSTADLRELIWPYRKVLGDKLWQLLFTPNSEIQEGDRSDRLWELECRLLESNVPVSEVMRIVKVCPWNKFNGRRDENKRILSEVLKAEKQVKGGTLIASDIVIPWINYSQLMGRTITGPGWMIKDMWVNGSWGLIAGEPKTYKSLIAMEMAVSVASGYPMWDQFKVDKTGPVLMIQEENAPWVMQDRLTKVANAKHLLDTRVYRVHEHDEDLIVEFPRSLPIRLLNNWGFDITTPEHQEMLEREVERIQPALVILDPLYLMIGNKDINSAQDLNEPLKWLLSICTKHHSSLIVLHHWNKGSGKNSPTGGGRILGSTALYAWVDSVLYTSERDRAKHEITLGREFRSYGQSDPLAIGVSMSDPGEEPRYEVSVRKAVDLMEKKPQGIMEYLLLCGSATTPEIMAATGYTSTGSKASLHRFGGKGWVTEERGSRGRGQNPSRYTLTAQGRREARAQQKKKEEEMGENE